MAKIGLYVYQLFLRRTDTHAPIPFAAAGVGAELYNFLPNFINGKLANRQNDNTERSWRLVPAADTGRSRHGLVQYGTYGYSSKIRDIANRELLYSRDATDVEEIPLYYQFWVPDHGNFGFAVLQSYRERSCVTPILGQLSSEFNDRFDHLRLNVKKIMPIDDDAYRDAPISKVILSKKRVPKDRAEILRNLPPEEFNAELSISASRRGRFGIFSDIAPMIRSAAGGAAFVLDGIEFDEASALVKIGATYRKVGIVGPTNTAGVIDVSEEIELDDDDSHPTFESISQVATETIADFRENYGMQ